MRSSLLFNYILLVATNPLCSNPSTCFLRLAGTHRYVSCLPVKMCIIYIWPTISFFLLCPWKSWTHTHARPLSSETASTHVLTHRFRRGLNFVNLWNFSEDAHTSKSEVSTELRLLGLHPICMFQRCDSLWWQPRGCSLLQRGLDVLRPDPLPTSLWFCTRDALPSILLNHSLWGWGDATSNKTVASGVGSAAAESGQTFTTLHELLTNRVK